MKSKSFILLLLTFTFIACQSDKKKKNVEASDIKIEFNNTKASIDSITLKAANASAVTTVAYVNDAALFNIGDSINDLYNLKLHTSQGVINKKLWLKGKNITVKGSLTPKLLIDTVINSPFYYQAQDNSTQLEALYNENEENPAIDSFLISKIKENLDSPISFVMADTYIYRNRERVENLKNLTKLYSDLPKNLKKHPFNINQRLNETIMRLENK